MHVNYFLVFIISFIFDLVYMFGKFWAYDGCYSSDSSETLKTLYFIFDAIKDGSFFFVVFLYLLYCL